MAGRTLAIGDIHGNLVQLDALLEAIALTEEDHLVLLGDYVDRGPDSAGVLSRIIALQKVHHLTAIMGNHEEMMVQARGGTDLIDIWAHFGGRSALRSYGSGATIRDVLAEHWEFLERRTVSFLETQTHIFVHACVDPDLPMERQSLAVLRWGPFGKIWRHNSGKIVVCGHTPQEGGRPANRGYAICLDTGAGTGGPLTGMDVGSGKIWQANSAGRVTRAHISDFAG